MVEVQRTSGFPSAAGSWSASAIRWPFHGRSELHAPSRSRACGSTSRPSGFGTGVRRRQYGVEGGRRATPGGPLTQATHVDLGSICRGRPPGHSGGRDGPLPAGSDGVSAAGDRPTYIRPGWVRRKVARGVSGGLATNHRRDRRAFRQLPQNATDHYLKPGSCRQVRLVSAVADHRRHNPAVPCAARLYPAALASRLPPRRDGATKTRCTWWTSVKSRSVG